MVSGVGVLYLLRSAGVLDLGPRLRDALPLEELARADAQPLARVAVSWLAAGAVAGVALGTLTRLRPAAIAFAAGVLALSILTLAGAASDAVESSERLLPDIAPQLTRSGLLAAVAFVGLGVYVSARLATGRAAPR